MGQLWAISAWLLAATGLTLALWALFWDRAKGRRRCPKCWYNLAGLPMRSADSNSSSPPASNLSAEPVTPVAATPPAPPALIGVCTCPECGHQPRSESRMLRTRRRWKWAGFAAILGLAAHTCARWPAISKHGAWAVVPTWALVRFAPMEDSAWIITDYGDWRSKVPRHGALIELTRRRDADSWGRATWRTYAERMLANDPRLLRYIFGCRDKWPDHSSHIYVRLNVSSLHLLGTLSNPHLRARIKEQPGEWSPLVDSSASWRVVPEKLAIEPSHNPCTLEGEIWIGPPNAPASWRLWAGDTRRITRVGPDEEVMTPVASSELLPNSTLFFETTLTDCGPQDLRVGLLAMPHHGGSTTAPDWALGARVEVLHLGSVVAEGTLLYPLPPKGLLSSGPLRSREFPLTWTHRPKLTKATTQLEHWSIRLIGDSHIAANDLTREYYWPGTVEVPVKQWITTGQDREGPSGT